MMDEFPTKSVEFLKANVTIGNWTQSRFYSSKDKPSCSTSLSSTSEHDYQSNQSDESSSANNEKINYEKHSHEHDEAESEITQEMLHNKRQDEAINYRLMTRASNLHVGKRHTNINAGIRGPSGSVRGYRDFVRQSARYLHELNELRANDQLIYVNSSSLLSRKILEQEANETTRHDDQDEAPKVNCVKKNKAESLIEEVGVEEEEDANEQKSGNHHKPHRDRKVNVNHVDDNKQIWEIKRQALRALYLENLILSEQDICVLYTTSLSVVRRTFDDSKLMRNILTLNLIRFEERDVYLNREYKIQLRLRLMTTSKIGDKLGTGHSEPPLGSQNLPCLFVEGRLFCNLKDLELLNETSQLSKILARFKMPEYSSNVCKCCGNARFIACQSCNGSRRSLVHHFRFSSVALRCTRCDKNDGLIACPMCNKVADMSAADETSFRDNNNDNN